MNYIIFDLEWNQSDDEEHSVRGLPFEIIEIGAVKYNEHMEQIGEFHELIRPSVYHHLHRITGRLIHMRMRDLRAGDRFTVVMGRFLTWCGKEERLFCTWGMMDLTELQRNMKYFGMAPLAQGPIPFLDVQKLYSIAYQEGKTRRALEYVIDALEIPKDIPFHRAFSDAYYTGKVLARIGTPELMRNLSYDVFHPPLNREGELKLQFDNYAKYISRQFDTKEDAFADPEVSSCKCYLCHRNLKKIVKWFTTNGRQYYCTAYCEKHGYLKGKIRVRRTDEGMTYIVKTTKLVSKEESDEIVQHEAHSRELRKLHRSNRGKRKRAQKDTALSQGL